MRSTRHKIQAEFFDLSGASAYLGFGVSVRALRRLLAQPGGLPYHRIGRGKLLIKKADLDAFLAEHRQEPVDLDRIASEALAELRGERR